MAPVMHVGNHSRSDTRLSTNQIRSQAFAQQRRSQRILLSVPILVSGQHPNGSSFSERTKTLVVNAHGALIQLRTPVLTGEGIRIKNLATNEELACTVVDINHGSTEIPEIGIAFAKPSPSFWRVSFPPEDWTPRSPDAKRASSFIPSTKPVMVKK
jgi:hypothetical protein